MLLGATSFDKPIGNWDTKNVAKMNRVFNQAISFNQGLENWDATRFKCGRYDLYVFWSDII